MEEGTLYVQDKDFFQTINDRFESGKEFTLIEVTDEQIKAEVLENRY